MTTFQALWYAILRGFTQFLPVGSAAHEALLSRAADWPVPAGPLAGALALGSFLALLVRFRHDWASQVSSLLQAVLFRRKLMALDERMPLFLVLSTLPALAAWYYLREPVAAFFSETLAILISLAAAGLLLGLCDSLNRKNRGMFDWNWLDALLVGVGQALWIVPGGGQITGAFAVSSARNYNRESALKFVLYASLPLLAAEAFFNLRETAWGTPEPMAGVSWLTWAVSLFISFFASWLAIGSITRAIPRTGFRSYVIYRVAIAIAFPAGMWLKGILIG